MIFSEEIIIKLPVVYIHCKVFGVKYYITQDQCEKIPSHVFLNNYLESHFYHPNVHNMKPL